MAAAGTFETQLNVKQVVVEYNEPECDYATKTQRYAPNYMRIWDSNGFPETDIQGLIDSKSLLQQFSVSTMDSTVVRLYGDS